MHDPVALADALRPALLQVGRELRREARAVGVSLTEEGQRVLRRVRSRRTAWLAQRLRGLSPEELAAVEAAVEPLRRLVPEGARR